MIRTELENSTRYHHRLLNKISYWLFFGILTVFGILSALFLPEMLWVVGIPWIISIFIINDSYYLVEYDKEKIWYGNLFGIRGEIHWCNIRNVGSIKWTNYFGLYDANGELRVKVARLFPLSGVFEDLYFQNPKLFELPSGKIQVTPVIQIRFAALAIFMLFGAYLGFTDLGMIYGFLALSLALLSIGSIGGITLEKEGLRINMFLKRKFIPLKEIINFGINKQRYSFFFVSYWKKSKATKQNLFQHSGHLNMALYYLKYWWQTQNDFTVELNEGYPVLSGFNTVHSTLLGIIRTEVKKEVSYAFNFLGNGSQLPIIDLDICNENGINDQVQIQLLDKENAQKFDIHYSIDVSEAEKERMENLIPKYVKTIFKQDHRVIDVLNLGRIE